MNNKKDVLQSFIIGILALTTCLQPKTSPAVTVQSAMESLQVLEQLSKMDDIILHELDPVDGEKPKCSLTNDAVEDLVRNYAKKYYGGTNRSDIANALDDIMYALYATADHYGNQNGQYDKSEIKIVITMAEESKGILVLCCLYMAYDDVPR